MTAPTNFRANDVVRYRSERENRWCREGLALAHGRHDGTVVLVDTFWGGAGAGDNHVLTDTERGTAELIFNTGDYDELDRYDRGSHFIWEKYAPEDRAIITSQHGLQFRWFIRKGASEHLPTQIANARAAVAEAERELSSARSTRDQRIRELDRLVGEQP